MNSRDSLIPSLPLSLRYPRGWAVQPVAAQLTVFTFHASVYLALRPQARFSFDDMNNVPRPRSRISLVAMIVGGLLAGAPLFGPLGNTLHYLADFIAERPQSMRGPDLSFFVELLALILCPVGLLMFAISLILFIRSGRRATPRA